MVTSTFMSRHQQRAMVGNWRAYLTRSGSSSSVSYPTRRNRILDPVISPRYSDFVRQTLVTDPIGESDHLVVLTSIRALKPKLPMKTVCYRPCKSVDPEKFMVDLSQSSFITNPSDDLGELLEQFICSVSDVLEKHAPLRRRRLFLRPCCSWFNSAIADARRHSRRV